jgi:hypothetical protein
MKSLVACLLLLLSPLPLLAQDTIFNSAGVKAGSKFVLTVNADGSMTVVPTPVVK